MSRVSRVIKVDVYKILKLLNDQGLLSSIVEDNCTQHNIKIHGICTDGKCLSIYYDDPTKRKTVIPSPLISYEELNDNKF